MDDQAIIEEDEIDLRKYIEIIIKRKILILSLFFVSVLVAAILSHLAPKVYKATASITITPAYETLLTSNEVLQLVVQKLDLKDPSGKPQDFNTLLQKLSIKKTTGTNGVLLSVLDAKPEAAQKVVNTWAEEYVKYTQGLVLKEEFASMELTLKSKEDFLSELKKQIEKQERFIIVSQTVTDDALLQTTVNGAGTRHLKTEILNPIYQDLAMRIINAEMDINIQKLNVEQLRKTIPSTTTEIKVLSSASLPAQPEGLSKMKTLVLAGIFGLMFGIFLALFMEFWEKERQC